MISDTAPLWVLRPSTVSHLSVPLQAKKLIPNENGHLRDWRGVAELSGLFDESGGHIYKEIENSKDHFKEVFNHWKKVPGTKVKDLFDVLELVDRFDVISDTIEKVCEDITLAEATAKAKGLELRELPAVQQDSKLLEGEGEALTFDDLHCLNTGQSLPKYDAFLLYGEDEQAFALDVLVRNLEAQGLRVVVKDRDLLGGTFEHAAVMKLISERCNKLITVFSNSFFNSEYNTFLATFAQHETLEHPGTIKNKIIPMVLEECDIPANLSLYNKLRYDPTKVSLHRYFWSRLVNSIKPSCFNPQIQMVEVDSNFPPKLSVSPSSSGTDKTGVTQQQEPEKTPSHSTETASKGKKVLVRSSKSPAPSLKTASQPPVVSGFSKLTDQGHEGSSSGEFSSLESDGIGDSGKLLLPDAPNDNLFSKIKKKLARKNKYKNKQLTQDTSC